MTYPMYCASLAWIILITGFIFRHKRSYHASMMTLGMLIDIILVLYLQVTRDAIQSAISLENSFFQSIHIVTSTLAIMFYLPLFFVGLMLLRNKALPFMRVWHIRFGILALTLRTIGFITMFSMLE